ncbi:unnamed protein product [Schistocephalus solidus]|uniref:WD_REPEATS_REGION domain-containing protein n=1 Tax=Schistocephalus solidus TaxID=70667 RepID=A0A183SNK8_SCHSO|nr:unnamed protein product [Schistocephalus solidus]
MSKSGNKNLVCEWQESKWRPDRCPEEPEDTETGNEFNQILACSCSLDGQRFITAGTDTNIRVYEISTRNLVGNCQSSYLQERMDGHVRRITALKYHPRGVASQFYAHLFISGSWDDSIQIWDDRYVHSLWQYFGPHICGNDALDIEPEANHIITSSWRRENSILQVWLFNEDALMNFFETGTKEPIRGSLSPAICRRNSDQHLMPLAEIAQNQFESPTSGYVARWLGTKFMLYGGSDENILKIIDKSTLNVSFSSVHLSILIITHAFVHVSYERSGRRERFSQVVRKLESVNFFGRFGFHTTTIASLSKFSRGVISTAFTLPQATEAKQTIRLAIASGCKVYIAVLDCSFS